MGDIARQLLMTVLDLIQEANSQETKASRARVFGEYTHRGNLQSMGISILDFAPGWTALITLPVKGNDISLRLRILAQDLALCCGTEQPTTVELEGLVEDLGGYDTTSLCLAIHRYLLGDKYWFGRLSGEFTALPMLLEGATKQRGAKILTREDVERQRRAERQRAAIEAEGQGEATQQESEDATPGRWATVFLAMREG